ncbi:hypothetical protein [Glycomyces albidus]|uniref:Uncharacterized protein n=1 Tax=Glycomyces albidus TaxID=2656774 RepID=A0A6L5G561_9ACTN|nr:hypothetical protein [Glycomyces albidus]MQM24778.1 hypothetical protein [Glycomyces albidus]
MPRSHNRTRFRPAPLAVLVLAAGCSSMPFAERTEAYELLTGAGGDSPWCAMGDDAWFLDQGADLKGPHFALSIQCRYQGTEIPESLQQNGSDALADLPAAAGGVELLVAQVAASPIYEPEFGEGEVASWIQVGDERLDLETLPADGEFVAVAAPEDEDAVLWVEDEGRAQGLDLRSGERVDPVAGYYNGLAVEAARLEGFYYEDFEVSDGRDSWFLTCPAPWANATRNAWLEDRGWAGEGQVFLTVSFNWCHRYDTLVWVLDPETAVTVDGASPAYWNGEETVSGSMDVDAVFTVPEDADDIAITFTPFGHVESAEDGEAWAFMESPTPTEWIARF